MSRVRISSPAPSLPLLGRPWLDGRAVLRRAYAHGMRRFRFLELSRRARSLLGACSAGTSRDRSVADRQPSLRAGLRDVPADSIGRGRHRRRPSRSRWRGSRSRPLARRRGRTTPGPSTAPARSPTCSGAATARPSSTTRGHSISAMTRGRSSNRPRRLRRGSGTKRSGSKGSASSSSPARPTRRRSSTTCGPTTRLRMHGPQLPATGAAPVARYGSCAAIGPDGRLWISHGFTQEQSRFSDTRAYDFASGTWTDETPAGPRPVERCLHGCWWTDAGELALYAGQTTGVTALDDRWILRDGAWSTGGGSAAAGAQPVRASAARLRHARVRWPRARRDLPGRPVAAGRRCRRRARPSTRPAIRRRDAPAPSSSSMRPAAGRSCSADAARMARSTISGFCEACDALWPAACCPRGR